MSRAQPPKDLLPEGQGQNLALTVFNVPYSLDRDTIEMFSGSDQESYVRLIDFCITQR